MRHILLIFCILLTGILLGQPANRINIQRNIQQATHNGDPPRFGGIEVQGVSVMSDYLGRQTYVRDTSILLTNGKIVKLYINLTNPSDTLRKDTIDSEALLQTLGNTNDSLAISLGNVVRRDQITVNNVSSIAGNFVNGTLVRTRGFSTVNDGAGALYQVQADSIAGYPTDGVAVIDLGSNYAVLQPQNGQYDVRWFGSGSTAFDKALAFGDEIIVTGTHSIKNVIIPSTKVLNILEGAIIQGVTSLDTIFVFSGSTFDVHVKGKGIIQNADIGFLHNGGSVLSGSSFEQINFTGVRRAFELDGSVGVDFREMKFQTNVEDGIVFNNTASTNANRIVDNKFLLFDSVAIEFLGGAGTSAGNLILGNWIEDGGSGIRILNNHSGLVIENNYFENVGGTYYTDITIVPTTSAKGVNINDNRFSAGSATQTYRVLLDNIIQAVFNGNNVFLDTGDTFANILASGSTASGIQFNYVALNATGGGTYESRLYSAVSTIDVSYITIPNSGFVTGDEYSKEFRYGEIHAKGEPLVYTVNAVSEIDDYARNLDDIIEVRTTGARYLVQAAAPAHYAADGVAVIAVGSNFAILQPNAGQIDVKWLGAVGDGVTDDGAELQAAIDYTDGRYEVLLSPGNYLTATSLTIPDSGSIIRGLSPTQDGVSSEISYSGAGSAFVLAVGFTSGYGKIELRNFQLNGTASALRGLDWDATGKSIYGAIIDNVVFNGFSNATAYAIELASVYNIAFTNCRWQNNQNDLLASGVVQSCLIDNTWLVGATGTSIHLNGVNGRFTIRNSIIDGSGTGIWQQAIVGTSDGIKVEDCHFESNNQNLNIDVGYFWLENSVLGNPLVTADNIADGVTAMLDNVQSQTTTPLVLGLGSTWSNLTGRFVVPAHTDASTITAPATVIEVNSTGPTSISGVLVAAADRFEGTMMLRFMDGNTTLQSTAGSNAQFYLEGDINWTPSAGDYILLKKYKYVTADRVYFIEVGRFTLAGERFYSSIVGGITTTSDLSFKTTTAAGATGADMHFLVGNNGATEAMTIVNAGSVGFGTTGPTNKIDIVATAGSQLRLSNVETDATNKSSYFDMRHYTNAEQDISLLQAISQATTTTLNVGGGTSLSNAVTQLNFLTAADNITTIGTTAMRINNAQEVLVGITDNGAYLFQVNGNAYNTGAISMAAGSNPSAATDVASIWAKDVVAGQTELYARGETGNPVQMTGLNRRLTSEQTYTTTTYTAVSDLTFNVEAGKSYIISMVSISDSIANGGLKLTLDGTCTLTHGSVQLSGAPPVSIVLGSNIITRNVDSSGSFAGYWFTGTVTINTAGTLGLQAAQFDGDGGTTLLSQGTYLKLEPTTN